MKNSNFSAVTGKDLRFMILLWRDGLLDPYKLSMHDRLFIHEVKRDTDKIMTHEMYLMEMEKRGLTSSLVYEGRLVFRANFSRNEVFGSYMLTYRDKKGSDEIDRINNYIDLIALCYDGSAHKVVIPETQGVRGNIR